MIKMFLSKRNFAILVFATFGFVCLWADDIAGEDKYIFKQDSLKIGPKVADPEACYYWEPKELFVDNTQPNPMVKVSETTEFTVTVTGKDFSSVKTGKMIVHFVKVESISGLAMSVCLETKVTLTAKLTGDIDLPKDWSLLWECDEANFSDPIGNMITAKFNEPSIGTGVYCWIKGSDEANRSKVADVVVGFEVKRLNDSKICDGSSVPLYIRATEGVSQSYLSCFSGFKLHSRIAAEYYGNPSGISTLTFKGVNANFESEIENAVWYATESDGCNSLSSYYVWATALNQEGEEISSDEIEIEVDATLSCIQGYSSCCATYFEGEPVRKPVKLAADLWYIEFSKGTLARHITTNPIRIITNPNSQFYEATVAEELYHDKQWDGTVYYECFEKVYVADSIVNNMKRRQSETFKLTEEEARVAGEEIYLECMLNEKRRSDNLVVSKDCRCAMEFDVKHYLNKQYITSWHCTYEAICNGSEDL
jgi:hypothetical protein